MYFYWWLHFWFYILGKENKKANQAVNLDKKPAADASYDKNEYSVNLGHLEFKVYQGDLTAIKVDAIVNGTNEDLDFSRGRIYKKLNLLYCTVSVYHYCLSLWKEACFLSIMHIRQKG